MTIKSAIWGRNAPQHGVAPALVLVNPKYDANVAKAVRTASSFGIGQVWWTGSRVCLGDYSPTGKGRRMPREERMKGYRDVSMIQYDRPFDQFPAGCVPVAIEVRENSENLIHFDHPENAVYVFGPEDGSIDSVLLQHCHRFVVIPTRHCLNLAMAVTTVLYDRHVKRVLAGLEQPVTPGEWEGRGVESDAESLQEMLLR